MDARLNKPYFCWGFFLWLTDRWFLFRSPSNWRTRMRSRLVPDLTLNVCGQELTVAEEDSPVLWLVRHQGWDEPSR